MNIFDFVNDITTEKKYLYTNDTKKSYVPFVINRALSLQQDVVQMANFVNINSHLDPQLQHDMYWYSLKKRPKRFQKWPQKNNENLNIIMKIYECSEKNAAQIQKILTEEQKAILCNIEETLHNATGSSSRNSK